MSTASPARVEANRRNAEFSTGPKTAEGKAASRANSYKHGMTGAGVVLPAEELVRISAIADELRQKHQPTTEEGLALVERAALLMVRRDRCGKHEIALVEDQVLQALFDFDQWRLDYVDDLFNTLADTPTAIHELMTSPEGVDRLILEWSRLAAIDEWTPEDLDRIALLSDAKLEDAASFALTIPDRIVRLEAIKAAIDPRPRDIARKRAADLALFSTSPEAILSRRYDAATDRALDKTLKELRAGGPEAELEPIPTAESPQVATPDATLGSFSPESPPPKLLSPVAEPSVVPDVPDPQVARARRPDPVKDLKALKRQKRQNRR